MLQIVVVMFKSGVGVIRRVDINAFDTSAIKRQERFKRGEVVALHNQVARILFAATQRRIIIKETIRNIFRRLERVTFSSPIQSRQVDSSSSLMIEIIAEIFLKGKGKIAGGIVYRGKLFAKPLAV